MGGAFGYDNVFGTANTLFIEEAIEETSVLMHGVPASFGRFTGGDRFSGSVRENLSNPDWIGETPRERSNGITHRDVLGYAHEATLGGPLRGDRLWFFAAGRFERAETPVTFAQTGGAFTRTDRNRRGELKLTGRLRAGDSGHVTYIGDGTEQANTAAVGATRLLDAVQGSMKRQRFEDNGGTGTAIGGSPFQTAGASPGVPGGFFYNAPYLDATDPESRNSSSSTSCACGVCGPPEWAASGPWTSRRSGA